MPSSLSLTPGPFTACQTYARSTMCVTSTCLFPPGPESSSRCHKLHLLWRVPFRQIPWCSSAGPLCRCRYPVTTKGSISSFFPMILTPSGSSPSTFSAPGAIGPYSNRSSERCARLVIDNDGIATRWILDHPFVAAVGKEILSHAAAGCIH